MKVSDGNGNEYDFPLAPPTTAVAYTLDDAKQTIFEVRACTLYGDHDWFKRIENLLGYIDTQNAELATLRTRNERLERVALAAKHIQYSDRVFHGLKHSEVESAWGDTEKCELCALRAAIAELDA